MRFLSTRPDPGCQPLSWTNIIPPVDTDPNWQDAMTVWGIAPLDCGVLWLDFGKIDANSMYTVRVLAILENGDERVVSRADIHFLKPVPNWPVSVHVNGAPQRFDGILDFGFEVYPFERRLTIVQTQGKPSTLRWSALTGFTQPATVSA